MKRIFLSLLLISIALFIPFFLCQSIGGSDLCKPFTHEYYFYVASGSIQLGILSAALFFLWKEDLWSTLKGIGFPGDIRKSLLYSVAGLAGVFVALFIFGVVATAMGVNDEEEIVEKVSSLPWYILIFAVLFAPISEELFFRAFLVPRVGIIFSSFLFGMVHFAYGSVMEIGGATLIGVILALVFRFSRSITPCLIIHMAYNLVSIAVMRLLI